MASSFDEVRQKPIPAQPWRERAADLLDAERDTLVLFIPVALGLGIALWFGLPLNGQRQAALVAALALALSGFAAGGLLRRLLVGAGLLVAAGLLLAEARSASVASPRLHHRLTPALVQGEIVGTAEREGGARTSLLLRRDATDIDPPAIVRLAVPGPAPAALRPIARVAVHASLAPVPGPALPGAFDPARRAWFEGVAATGRALGPPQLLAPAPGTPRLATTRAALARHLRQLGGDAGGIAVALVVGEQGQVRPALLEAMRISGLAHLLTVSGFHIGVVVAGTLWLLRRLLALWPWLVLRTSVTRVAAVAAGLAGTGYALLSGAEVPAIRAAVSAWVVLLALMLGRDPVSLRLIAFAAVVILVPRPEALLNPGFQLSFAAVTALVLLANSRLGAALARHPEDGFLLRAARLLAAMLCAGLVAELVLTPIALAHFGRAGAYGVLANLVAIPLTGFVIMPLLGLWLLLSAVGLGGLAQWALVPALDLLAGLATRVAAWPGSTLTMPALPPAALALMVAGALVLALLAGRLRLLGAPLLAAGLALAVFTPRPDLFVSADGRQVAVVHEGQLHMLRAHRDGFLPSLWAERAAAPATARLDELPGARCTASGCAVPLNGLAVLALTGPLPPGTPPSVCAAADIVTSPEPLPAACAPRWRQLDRAALRESGAVAIHSATRRLETVADRTGDQPWSPSALPGKRPRLLGAPAWNGVLAE